MPSSSASKIKPVYLAGLGLLFIAAFFILIRHSRLPRLVQLDVPKEQILAQADTVFSRSPASKYSLSRKVDVALHDDLVRYAQTQPERDSLVARLPLGEWDVTWRGETENAEGKKEKVHFGVKFDFKGRLVGVSQYYPEIKDSPELREPEALARAMAFLTSWQLDTSAFALTQRRSSQEDEVAKHEFVFKRPSRLASALHEKLTVEISGSEITRFIAELELDKELAKVPRFEEKLSIVFIVLTVVFWLAVIVMMLTTFFRRVRHDELEFKHALWAGLAVLLVTWLMTAIESRPEWMGMTLGGAFLGFLAGGSVLIIYAAMESLTRDVWPEKLALIDFVFRGRLRVKEIGIAIFNAFYLAGLSLLVFGALIWLTSHIKVAYFEIDDHELWLLQGPWEAVRNLCSNFNAVAFGSFLFLGFWNSYLHSKLNKTMVLAVLLALSLNLTGFNYYYLSPIYVGFILILPFTWLWSRFALKYDLLTIFLALFIFYGLFDLVFIPALPEGMFSDAGIVTMVVIAVLLLLAAYLSRSPHAVQDFQHYVPEYVSRIAERERLLKELEIARSVQMRFLPARVPAFPRLSLASVCRPAMEVGGDYFDFVPHGDHGLSVFIGDVSGKGVSAAFYMTMVKGIIKTLCRQVVSPRHLLSELNTVFYENSPREIFISLIYGYFDMRNNVLTFARAGHNPLIVRKSAKGQPELLNPTGIAIGMDPGPIFSKTIEEITVPLAPEDMFVFYTDGISESMNNNGEEFGEQRLSELISHYSQESAQAVIDKVTSKVADFSNGAMQHDDFTMVVVKVEG